MFFYKIFYNVLLLQQTFVPSGPWYLITKLLNSVLRSKSTFIIETVPQELYCFIQISKDLCMITAYSGFSWFAIIFLCCWFNLVFVLTVIIIIAVVVVVIINISLFKNNTSGAFLAVD